MSLNSAIHPVILLVSIREVCRMAQFAYALKCGMLPENNTKSDYDIR